MSRRKASLGLVSFTNVACLGDTQKGANWLHAGVAPYCPHAPSSITSPTRELVTWMEPGTCP